MSRFSAALTSAPLHCRKCGQFRLRPTPEAAAGRHLWLEEPRQRSQDQGIAEHYKEHDSQANRDDTVDAAKVLRPLHHVSETRAAAEQLGDNADLPAHAIRDA